MVSVHQLFSDELPDEDLALGSVLKKRRRLLQRRQRRSLLQTFPRPNLGFSEDLDVAPHILEATVEQASIQRAKASRRLRAALLRNGVVPRSSTRSPTRWGSPPPCKTSEASVPAVFPFPEPIPQEIPPRRRSTQSRAASSLSARTSPTPGDERLGSPIPSAPSAPTSRPSSRNNVPAVFPFPEPIPHEVPRRLRRETPSGAAEIERKPSPEPEGAMKLRVHDPAFVAEQRRIANGWIQETAPQGAVGNGKRPGALWLLLKKEMEHQRERHRTAFRNMPCMPFDVWLLMKDEEDIATAGGSKVEPPEVKEERKHYYRWVNRGGKCFWACPSMTVCTMSPTDLLMRIASGWAQNSETEGFATSAASVQKQHQDLMLGRSGTVLGTTSVEHTRPGFRLSEPEKLDT